METGERNGTSDLSAILIKYLASATQEWEGRSAGPVPPRKIWYPPTGGLGKRESHFLGHTHLEWSFSQGVLGVRMRERVMNQVPQSVPILTEFE